MQVTVNGTTVDLAAGMKVHHALLAYLQGKKIDAGTTVTDRWGNIVGLDGELSDGTELVIKTGARR